MVEKAILCKLQFAFEANAIVKTVVVFAGRLAAKWKFSYKKFLFELLQKKCLS